MKNVFAPLLLSAALTQGALVPRDDSAPDFASLAAQPQPTVTGPTAGAVQQTVVVADTAASASGSAAASTTGNSKRTFCWGWWCPPPPPPPKPTPCTTTKKPVPGKTTSKPAPWKPTSTPWTTTTLQKTTSVSTQTTGPTSWVQPSTCSSSTYTPYYPATKTMTPVGGSGTGTTSSSTSCPTQPENGTYCGFINPNDPCAPQPDGYGPVPTPDSDTAFLNYPPFHAAAQSANTPAGYTQVFKDLNASVAGSNYLGLVTLQSYSPDQCASACQCTELCSSFNIFIERDPSLAPADACPNPGSMTSYKCTLWGGPINATDATNDGGYRDQFHVVITASNGYVATPATAPPAPQPGWGNGNHCPGGGISDGGHHMGGHFFPGPFDPRICAAFADAQTKANRDACAPGGQYQACNLWNAYALKRNGHYWGMFCNLFTDHPSNKSEELGSYTGGFSAGVTWEVGWSWSQCHDGNSWDFGMKPN